MVQMMDEIFNQLAGTAVPVIALVQTLAEFAKLHGLCCYHYMVLLSSCMCALPIILKF
jgi:hypothetical protein